MRAVYWLLIPWFLFAFSPKVEKLLDEMSLEEKIGQLFAAPICPRHERSEEHWSDWQRLLREFHIGNALVKQSNPEEQIELLNALQKSSKHPILVLADAEWGLGMRMSETISFPRNMTLGAVGDLDLLEELGREIAREARLVGIHMNLAPVVDVNNNPKNPVIHMRSFGDDPEEVGERGAALVRGMKKGGLLCCLKHFPGHGDTDIDSHFGLPRIAHPKERLQKVELLPFERGIRESVDAIMTAHILVPALDPDVPATLSQPVLTSLLRETLGFQGLIITDALNMQAVTDSFSAEEIALQAHVAGADVLLYGSHIFEAVDSLIHDSIPRGYKALLAAYKEGQFPMSRLNESVGRILSAKESLHLFHERTVKESPNLHTESALRLKDQLFMQAATLVGPDFSPISDDTSLVIFGCLCSDRMRGYFLGDNIIHAGDGGPGLIEAMAGRRQIVVSLRELKASAVNFGITDPQLQFMHELAESTELIICLFGSPYALPLLPKNATVLIGYEDDESSQHAVGRILQGLDLPKGKIPISFE